MALPRPNATWMALVVGLVAVAAFMLAPGLAIGPSLDAAVFTWIGEQVLRGSTLYVDVWDHKPPGAYAVTAGAQLLLPWLRPWPAVWIVSVLASAGIGLSVAISLGRLSVRPAAITVTALATTVAGTQYLTALGGGLTEPVATLLAAAALAVGLASPLDIRRLAAMGLLLGAGLLVSLQVAPGVLAIASLAMVLTGGSRWRGMATMASGFAIPWGVSILVLAMTGALGVAYEAVVGYGAAYRASTAALGSSLSGPPAAWTALAFLFLITAAGLGALACWRAGGQRRWVLAAMLAWLVAAAVSFPIQGRFIAHYAIPLVVPLGVLAGIGLEGTASRWARARGTSRVILVLPVVITLVIAATAGHLGSRQELATNEATGVQVRAMADYVLEHTTSDDAILVWGNRPEIYLASDRRAAIPHPYMFPLTTEGFASAELLEGLAARMRANPPALVIDAGSTGPGMPGFLPLLIPRPVAEEGREIDLLSPLREFVRDAYVPVTEVEGWPIYQFGGGVSSR